MISVEEISSFPHSNNDKLEPPSHNWCCGLTENPAWPILVHKQLKVNRPGIVHSMVLDVVGPGFAPHIDNHAIGGVLKTSKHYGLSVAFLVHVRIVSKRKPIRRPERYSPDVFLIHWRLEWDQKRK